MSEVMLGVLRMPTDLWTNDPLDVVQRHGYYTMAADEIDRLRARVAELEDEQRNGNLAAKELYQEAKRLRAALEAFPEDDLRLGAVTQWMKTTRAEVLK